MDAAIALTSAGNVGTATPPDGYGTPSTTPTTRSIGMGVQKYGRTTGFQLGTVAGHQLLRRRLLLRIRRVLLPGLRSAVRQPDLGLARPVQRAGRFRLSYRHAGWESAGRAPLRRRRKLTIGNPIDPGAAALRRHDRRRAARRRAARRPHRPLRASPGDASVSLSWNAPTFDGGSPITNYKVYPRHELRRAEASTPTLEHDDELRRHERRQRHDLLLQGVRRERERRGPALERGLRHTGRPRRAGRARSRRRRLRPPQREPALGRRTLDERRHRLGETGLYIDLNQLACSKTTTCTAWRNAAQYGPDVEVWARVATAARHEQPASPATRASSSPAPRPTTATCCARTSSAGTDQILLERLRQRRRRQPPDRRARSSPPATSSSCASRARRIEAWRHRRRDAGRGSASSRTRPTRAPGYAGVGLRGTTGRLDDFGARTLERSSSARRAHRPHGRRRRRPASSSPGTRPPSTAARRSRATRSTGARAPGGESFLASASTSTSYHRRDRRQRHDLLLQGVRRERERRGPALERGLRHTVDLVAPVEPARRSSTTSTAQTRTRSRTPDAGRTASSARRERPLRHLQPARLLEDDDLHGLAQRNPVRPRRRGLGARLHRCPARTTSFACTRVCRLRAPRPTTATCCAPTSSAGTDQILLERIDNGAAVTRLTVTRSSPPATSCSCASRARRSRSGAIDGSDLVAARLRAGHDLRRPRATPASACAARPVGSTTSGRARTALRRPTPNSRRAGNAER